MTDMRAEPGQEDKDGDDLEDEVMDITQPKLLILPSPMGNSSRKLRVTKKVSNAKSSAKKRKLVNNDGFEPWGAKKKDLKRPSMMSFAELADDSDDD